MSDKEQTFHYLKMFFNFENIDKKNVSTMKSVIVHMLSEICELDEKLNKTGETDVN